MAKERSDSRRRDGGYPVLHYMLPSQNGAPCGRLRWRVRPECIVTDLGDATCGSCKLAMASSWCRYPGAPTYVADIFLNPNGAVPGE